MVGGKRRESLFGVRGRLGGGGLASASILSSSIGALVVSAPVILVLVGLVLVVTWGSILGCSPAHSTKGPFLVKASWGD